MKAQRTILSILLAGVLMITSAYAQSKEVQSATPGTNSTLQVSETEFDFGRVAQGASVSHVFWMKNAGSDPLQVTDVKPGCGCTKAPFESKILAAGESTHVELIFSTGHYSSSVRKNALIISDATGTVPRLSFHADVRTEMESLDIFAIQPHTIDLDQHEGANKNYDLEYRFSLRNHSDEDLTFSLLSVPDGLMTIDFPEGQPLSPGEQLKFTARFDKGITSEVFTKSFTIQASDANGTRLTVPISKTMRWGPAPTSQR